MTTLHGTVAIYDDAAGALKDWATLEMATETLHVADAAFIQNRDGEAVMLQQQARHGWWKGAIAGAVVGVLLSPSLLAAAVVGAAGGALVARATRSLDRTKVRGLGRALHRGSLAIVVVEPAASTEAVTKALARAKTVHTAPTAAGDELRELITSVQP